RLARWSRRHQTLVRAGAASLALTALFAVAFAAQQARFADQQTRSADRLRVEQGRTVEALKKVAIERDHANRESRKALQSLADYYLERARPLLVGNDPGGLLWLTRAAETAPADDATRQSTTRLNISAWERNIHNLNNIFSSSIVLAFSPDGKTV